MSVSLISLSLLYLSGQSHVLALTARGHLFSWGAGFYGRLGLGTSANVYVPAMVEFPTPVRVRPPAIARCCCCCCCCCRNAHRSNYWGSYTSSSSSSKGCSSNCITSATCSLLVVIGVSVVVSLPCVSPSVCSKIKDIAAGAMQSMCLTDGGEIWVWGRRECLCATQHILTPKLFLQLEGPQGVSRARSIAACGEHCLAVTDDGRVTNNFRV